MKARAELSTAEVEACDRLRSMSRNQPELLIHATREKAAVHRQQVPRDEARRLRREKNGGARQFFRSPEAPHRGPDQELATALSAVEETFVERSAEHAGKYRVHADAVRRPLHRERF